MSADHQHQLAAELQRIKALIVCKRDGLDTSSIPDVGMCEPVERTMTAFALTPFERDLMLWCAGVELDSSIGDLTATLPGRDGRRSPSFSLALSVLPEAHWSALVPMASLRYWRIIELGNGSTTQADLRIDERVLHELAGVPYLDQRLSGLVRPTEDPAPPLSAGQSALAGSVAEAWRKRAAERPIIQLTGRDAVERSAIAAQVAVSNGFSLFHLGLAQLPAQMADLEGLVRLWQRECLLDRRILLVERSERGGKDEDHAMLSAFCATIGLPFFLCGAEPFRPTRQPVIHAELKAPDALEKRAQWRSALGERADALNGTVDRLVDQYDLSAQEIRSAIASAGTNGALNEKALRQACRDQARPKLDGLAQRIHGRAGWNDLILAERETSTLRDIALHLAHRGTVFGTWGFGRKNARGRAITALFAGPSGTGKTLAAEILAHELDLDLYKIDLSQVVSKYIGESEKNLARIFDAAERSGAILFFDEADALFGKRSEVKDSHDRYANIEVSYLLQRMEEYHGLAILTTNMKQALDPAFMRRLTFVVNFRFPDQLQRAAIWQRMFPPECPVSGLDAQRLAQLSIPGGNIRSISLNAAHYAAADGTPVGMAHVLRAARSEYDKLDKALSSAEIKGWK